MTKPIRITLTCFKYKRYPAIQDIVDYFRDAEYTTVMVRHVDPNLSVYYVTETPEQIEELIDKAVEQALERPDQIKELIKEALAA
jgi:hypothetical protein